MEQLLADECRVLGVLVEKELTTPAQYPLSLNAIINGCNQKNNRWPVLTLDEERVVRALDGLRDKKMVIYADTLGSRVMKYKHSMQETLAIGVNELVILTELLLRGPQTTGELRGRASRMHPLESMEIVQNTLQLLMDRPEPLVRRLPPSPGVRAQRFVQLLCPDLHPLDESSPTGGEDAGVASTAPAAAGGLAQRVADLEQQVELLRQGLHRLAAAVGEEDVLPPPPPPAQPPDDNVGPTAMPRSDAER